MRINGWQRLWLLASILWAVVILALAGIQTVQNADAALFVVRLWIVPVAAVYGCGLGLAWVRRGFQVESKRPQPASSAFSHFERCWGRRPGPSSRTIPRWSAPSSERLEQGAITNSVLVTPYRANRSRSESEG